jgi:Fe-S-cluster-containing hydrogenase component 2
MQNLICYKFCASPFCEVSCPAGAISISTKDGNVYVDTDKCNRCGICRGMCVTLSFDRNLECKRPWVPEDWVRPKAR